MTSFELKFLLQSCFTTGKILFYDFLYIFFYLRQIFILVNDRAENFARF